MKHRHPILALLGATTAFIAIGIYWAKFSAPDPAAPKETQASQLNSSQKDKLNVIALGLRSLKFPDAFAKAQQGHQAMDSFLESWNPNGRTIHELKAVFGEPREQTDDYLLYVFDNGMYGWLYQFVLSQGRVVDLQRPPSE